MSQTAPVTHLGHRQVPQPSWGSQEEQKGLQVTVAEEKGAKEGTAAERSQEGPKKEGRRDLRAGIFP